MGCRKWCTPRNILTVILPHLIKGIIFKICMGMAIHHIVEVVRDYKKNEVATVVRLHQNESVWLPDSAVCVPLTFMTQDTKLIWAAKHTLLHDSTFLSKALHLENETASKMYWSWRSGEGTNLNAQGLIESFVNETLKPFLKNVTFPEENPLDSLLAHESDVFDIVETASGTLVNKTILLASVALIDVITGYGQGRQSASSLLSDSTQDMTPQEMDLVATMSSELLKSPVVADQFSFNVARTLCEIFAPEWTGNADEAKGPTDICGPDGILSKTPYYISLNQFCFNIPTSSSPFTKSSPTSTLTLNLPLAQTIFSFGPLSQYINESSASIRNGLPASTTAEPEIPETPFPMNLSSSEEENNETIDLSEVMNKVASGQGSSLFGFNLPFAIPHQDSLNLSFLNDNDTDPVQLKIQRQLEDLAHTDLLALAFRFPIIRARPVTVYFPNDMRYYDSDGASLIPTFIPIPIPSPVGPPTEDFYSKVFKYTIRPTELVNPGADAVFGVTESRVAMVGDSQCSQDVSVASCQKRCTLDNTKAVCGCVPFGTQRLTDSDISTNFRFCQLDDASCIDRVQQADFDDDNVTTTITDCKVKCRSVCSATKYKWRETKPKPNLAPFGSNVNAMITGQPTHWTWTLTCDSFDYVAYIDQQMITKNQCIAQIGGILGFYGAILGLFLIVCYIIRHIVKWCCRKRMSSYDVEPTIVVKGTESNGYFGYNHPTTVSPDVRKAIEEAVKAEMMIWKYEPVKNGGIPSEKKIKDEAAPKDTYVSRLMIGSYDA